MEFSSWIAEVNYKEMMTVKPNRTGRKKIPRKRLQDTAFGRLAILALALMCCALPGWAQQSIDWPGRIRQLVADHRIDQALTVSDQWLAAAPQDLEARGWRARLLAWSNRWNEAEAEYRRVLESAPADNDILLGLADVLTWQKRPKEALEILDRACALKPDQSECSVRRGRVLQSLGRIGEARAAFRQALDHDASSPEARSGLESLREESRHEFRIGSDLDFFNFTENAGAVAASLRSRFNNHWATSISATQYRRFGEDATRFSASGSYRLNSSDVFTLGLASARHQGVIPKSEAFLEYGRGFRLASSLSPLRGIEALYRQHWLWYRDARIMVATPGAILYFPHDWQWHVQVSAARSHFPGTEASWTSSGMTRLSFPLNRQLSGHVLYAVGTENFGLADQIGQFSARAWGGGLKLRLAPGQEISSYGVYQNRSQARSQTSFGVSYAIRF